MGGGQGSGRRGVVVLAEPAGLVVERGHDAGERVEAPQGLALAPPGGEGERDDPLALVGTSRVPAHGGRVDLAASQALGHARLQRRRRAVRAAARPQPHLTGQPGHVLTLGEDRSFVLVHLLDRPPRAVGDLLGRQPGPDHRLHGGGAQTPGLLDLQLTQARPVTPGGRPQRVVEGHRVAIALGVGQQQVQAVLVDADEREVLHGWVSRSSGSAVVCVPVV